MELRKLGAILSPPDNRDYKASDHIEIAMANQLPNEFIHDALKVLDQGGTGSCVPHTLIIVKQRQEFIERGKIIELSPQCIYWDRDSDDYKGEGMYPREALDILKNHGICEYYLMPSNKPFALFDSSVFTQKVRENAKYQVIDKYVRVDATSKEELKTAIITQGKIPITIPVYSEFDSPSSSTGRVDEILKGSKNRGFHEVGLIGWNDYGWWIQNSWNDSYGVNGCSCIPYSYPIIEAWSSVDKYYPPPAEEYIIIFNIGDKNYTVNNIPYTMDTSPMIKKDKTMVPVRFVASALGYGISYNAQKKEVKLNYKNKEIRIYINSDFYYLNGESRLTDIIPYIDENNRTMIPIRMVVEALGGKVDYNNGKITIMR